MASNVSLGSQALGVVGPVGWIGLFEGPGGEKKAFYKDKSTVILYCISALLRMGKCLHIQRNVTRPSHRHQSNCTFGPLNFFFFSNKSNGDF